MTWSASQYLKFEDERTRPARDLLASLPLQQVELAYDLGCGPGNSTELIVARFLDAEIIGVDNDFDMLTNAQTRLPDTKFVNADLLEWQPEKPVDFLFANAVFQWIPDHISVLKRLIGCLKSNGVLAVQMPDNLNEPTHLLMEEVALSLPFASHFEGRSVRRNALPHPKLYLEELGPHCANIDIWHTVYYHKLANANAIVEWVQGTGLRPYLSILPEKSKTEFLEAYLAKVKDAYPPMIDGSVLLRFPRLFIVATTS